MEEITDQDYRNAKRFCKDFEMKSLGEFHDLHVQNDNLLLADEINYFRNMSLEIYGFDPAHFFSVPGLAWQLGLERRK